MSSGRNWIFFLRKITKRIYRYRGLSRVADLVRKTYIHDPRRFRIEDFDGDLFFNCALNEHISSQIFWRAEYSTDQLPLFRRVLKPGMVFLDAGANKGEFSIIASKYIKEGKVLAFEPAARTADELRENIAANGVSNVQVFEKGLGRAAGKRMLYHVEDETKEELNLGTFTLYPRTGLEKPGGSIELVSLDALDIGRIDVMKIDIEGGELEMLEGAEETIRRWKPILFIEVNAITSRAAGYDHRDILRWLEKRGYRCERIGRKGRTFPVTVERLKDFQNLVCWSGEGGNAEKDGSAGEGKQLGKSREKIAFFIPDMRGGGAEKALSNLLGEWAARDRSAELDLVLVRGEGVYLNELPTAVRIIDLKKKRTLFALPGLVRYLRKNKPSVLISNLSHANIVALLAGRWTGSRVPVVVVEHAILHERPIFPSKQWIIEWMMKKMYPRALARVAVSVAAAKDLAVTLGMPEEKIITIYNPVVNEALREKAARSCAHRWLEKKEMPVFLAVGRLEREKDFSTLLDAFARVRARRPARLIILGEGRGRKELEAQTQALGLGQDVDLRGFEENPYAYMSRCDALVSSSRWEGLSQVLIEAMACGCPVISTDCPGGPREILGDGRFGLLVPVGDAEAMGKGMMETLDRGGEGLQAASYKLQGRNGKEERMERAAWFSAERAVDAWSELLRVRGKRVVLHLITDLHLGGAERMLCQLLSALDRREWDPVVISLSDGSGPETWLREQGIPVHSLGMPAGKWPGFMMTTRLIRLVRKIRPDLIQGWMYHGNLAAQFAHLFLSRRLPVIWSIHHSIGSLAAEKGMTRKMIRLGATWSWLPEKIVFVSETSKEQHIVLGYRAEKAWVIPNGVDPGVWLPSAGAGVSGTGLSGTDVSGAGVAGTGTGGARSSVREELGLPSDTFLIGSLARYHPIKDHENLLRAAALLLQRREDDAVSGSADRPHFLLAGAGVDDRNETLKSLIRELGLDGRVHLLGERGDAARLLAALDIFTVTSFSEALPMVLLEAMSCGVPAVSTDTGDAAKAIGETGRVVAIRDPEALAGAWEELIGMGEEKRSALGEAARARIMTHYTLSASAIAYAALYREYVE